MFKSLFTIPENLAIQEKYLRGRCSLAQPSKRIAILFAIVVALEFTTPSEYLFGYLYTGPILLANSRLSRLGKLQITLVAATLTLLNLFVPHGETIALATVANRSIAVMALGVTGYLSDRNQQYEEAIAQTKAQLQSQQQLASIREDFVSTLSHDLKTPMLRSRLLKLLSWPNLGMSLLPSKKFSKQWRDRTQAAVLAIQKGLVAEELLAREPEKGALVR